jgi:hypothetical protein
VDPARRGFGRFLGFFGFLGFGVLLLASACAAHIFVPPAGAGASAPEAARAWTEATRSCADVHNASGTLRVALRRGRLRSTSRVVSVTVTSAGGIRLEDSTAFLLAGTSARTQLLLRQDRRLVTARADDIVDALVGVKLGPERLLAILSGCATTSSASARADGAARFGAEIAMPVDDGRVFLQARDGRWRVVAADLGGLIVEFRAFEGDWPLAWRAAPAATAAGGEPVILDVGVEGRDVNAAAIDPKTFELNPADATPMTLEGLRDWVKGRK